MERVGDLGERTTGIARGRDDGVTVSSVQFVRNDDVPELALQHRQLTRSGG